jgi:hypothetical protein
MDADSLTPPGTQDALISAVVAGNPRTIVVTLGAGPVVMPWLADVPAVIHAWFPGERFAPALAEVLVGQAEPGGRQPWVGQIDELFAESNGHDACDKDHGGKTDTLPNVDQQVVPRQSPLAPQRQRSVSGQR